MSRPPRPLGHPHLHQREIGSTSDRARELAIAGAPHGTLVSADVQTAGRGRQGRGWASPRGALMQSLVLRAHPAGTPPIPLAAAVAVAELCGPAALIKWPNDIWAAAPAPGQPPRKLAGILVEAQLPADWAVLGIGINAAVELDGLPAEVRARAGSLGCDPLQLPALRERLLRALERTLAMDDEQLRASWSARDALRGRTIRWLDGVGVAEGIDADGSLLVATAAGRQTLRAGEVHLEPL